MTQPQTAPYGSWRSPITADLIASATVSLGSLAFDGDDLYWTEMRPPEAGRVVLVRRTADGTVADVMPPPFSARTRVHEYGGGAFAAADGTVYFSNFADQRVYRVRGDGPAEPITPQPLPTPPPSRGTEQGEVRYADYAIDERRNRLIAVREDHSDPNREPVNTIATIALDGSGGSAVLVQGNDFYAAPRLSPDGARLAWLTWNHPNLPWDAAELWVADVAADGTLASAQRIAGGGEESIVQPEWSPAGVLHFVSDRSGWWNLYRWGIGEAQPLCPLEAEFGAPQWVFGASLYGFESADRIVCAYSQSGTWRLAHLDVRSGPFDELKAGSCSPIDIPFTSISALKAQSGRVAFIGASPAHPPAVVQLDLATEDHEVLRRATDVRVDPGYLSAPQAIEFPTGGQRPLAKGDRDSDGTQGAGPESGNGLTAHGFFYPPANRDYSAPTDERPPLLVMSHGGPTSSTSTALRLNVQFWTSRGFAVLDVDYGGSSGYGRAYRQRLDSRWGIVDVDDCVNGARSLVQQDLVDPNRMAITGGSAGGYTTLCALTFREAFRTGASYYGVSDLEALARDTHKFESRYLDRLIGPYPGRQDLYRERSPIHFVDRLTRPVIFFQGLDDKIVPPNQAEMMVDALRKKGLPVAYLAFEGEQHGFRKAETIQRSLEAELYFYSRIFGLALADQIEPVNIENL